jgi:hypothetical protein
VLRSTSDIWLHQCKINLRQVLKYGRFLLIHPVYMCVCVSVTQNKIAYVYHYDQTCCVVGFISFCVCIAGTRFQKNLSQYTIVCTIWFHV